MDDDSQSPVPVLQHCSNGVRSVRGRGVSAMLPSAPLRVFVTDDHEVVRDALSRMLGSEDGIEVVGAAGSVAASLTQALDVQPDVAILDVKLPDGSGIELCRQLHAALPDTRCVILTGMDAPAVVDASCDAGASAFVSKQASPAVLIEAVRLAASASPNPEPKTNRPVLVGEIAPRRTDTGMDPRVARLTVREMQVLQLVTEGLTNRQIGQHLGIAERTVKNVVSHVLDKLQLPNRTQAALFGAEVLKAPCRPPRTDAVRAPVPATERRTRPPAKSRVVYGVVSEPEAADAVLDKSGRRSQGSPSS